MQEARCKGRCGREGGFVRARATVGSLVPLARGYGRIVALLPSSAREEPAEDEVDEGDE